MAIYMQTQDTSLQFGYNDKWIKHILYCRYKKIKKIVNSILQPHTHKFLSKWVHSIKDTYMKYDTDLINIWNFKHVRKAFDKWVFKKIKGKLHCVISFVTGNFC